MKPTTFSAAEIDLARRLLGLDEKASIREIKTAYRRLCKQWHPDLASDDTSGSAKIREVNAAYRLLLDYCETYRFSFAPEKLEYFDPEAWWYQRFGENIRSPDGEETSED